MAELAHIQRAAVAAASGNSNLNKPVVAGRLIAITTNGVHDQILPQMAGTILDRSIDLDPNLVHRLAVMVAEPRPEAEDSWASALRDVGAIEEGELLAPTLGAERLSGAIELQRELGHSPAQLKEISAAVAKLAARSREAAKTLESKVEDAEAAAETMAFWSEELQSSVQEVLRAVGKQVRRATGV